MNKILSIMLLGISCQTMAFTDSLEEITCPIGGEKFTELLRTSGSEFNKTLDFMLFGPLGGPWPLIKCPSNGYVIYRGFTAEQIKIIEPFVLSKEYQNLQMQESTYYVVYILMSRLEFTRENKINILLSATWQANGKQYQRYATELLHLLEQPQTDIQINPYDALLEIELNRRLGNFEIAHLKLQKFQNSYLRNIEQKELKFFKQYLKQQQKLIKNKDQTNAEYIPDEKIFIMVS